MSAGRGARGGITACFFAAGGGITACFFAGGSVLLLCGVVPGLAFIDSRRARCWRTACTLTSGFDDPAASIVLNDVFLLAMVAELDTHTPSRE